MLKALRTLPRSSQTYCSIMAGATGLEPVISASKAGVLPLHYTPILSIIYNRQSNFTQQLNPKITATTPHPL